MTRVLSLLCASVVGLNRANQSQARIDHNILKCLDCLTDDEGDAKRFPKRAVWKNQIPLLLPDPARPLYTRLIFTDDLPNENQVINRQVESLNLKHILRSECDMNSIFIYTTGT